MFHDEQHGSVACRAQTTAAKEIQDFYKSALSRIINFQV